jgi:hypothetical protein
MLRFLLDEHLSPSIAAGIRDRRPEIQVECLQSWRDGAFLSGDDESILAAAAADGLTLVTFDVRTIPPLLRVWTEGGRPHAGVVFVHRQSIRPADVGGLVRALIWLWDATGDLDWTDRIVFLKGTP